jgi:hypothetical protein
MNNSKSLATAFAAILLTAALANAQVTVNKDTPSSTNISYSGDAAITFSVTVEEIAKLTVDNKNLLNANLARASTATGNLAADELKLAGVIDVETNLARWDVTVSSANGGKLKKQNGTTFLKASSGTAVADATLKIAACYAPGPSTTTCTYTGNPNVTTAGSGVISGNANTAISLGTALGKGTTFFADGDTDTSNKGHFGIYAIIPNTYSSLAGDGTYEESLSVTFISKY